MQKKLTRQFPEDVISGKQYSIAAKLFQISASTQAALRLQQEKLPIKAPSGPFSIDSHPNQVKRLGQKNCPQSFLDSQNNVLSDLRLSDN